MIGQMGSYEYPSSSIDEPLDCYLHGYVSSRIMNIARASEKGLPVSVAASKVDGIVLSLTPNSHSYNYRSAILQGYASTVTEPAEKAWAMELITNSVFRDRYANTRVPPDSAEMSSTVILRVKIVGGSGKIRDGGPNDDKKDTDRDDITAKVWKGVVPVWETYGEPIESPLNRVQEVPQYISSYIAETNEANEILAKAQAGITTSAEKNRKD